MVFDETFLALKRYDDTKGVLMPSPDHPGETLPSEVLAFCRLIARILHRCLHERNARILELLKQPPAISTESLLTQKEHDYE